MDTTRPNTGVSGHRAHQWIDAYASSIRSPKHASVKASTSLSDYEHWVWNENILCPKFVVYAYEYVEAEFKFRQTDRHLASDRPGLKEPTGMEASRKTFPIENLTVVKIKPGVDYSTTLGHRLCRSKRTVHRSSFIACRWRGICYDTDDVATVHTKVT